MNDIRTDEETRTWKLARHSLSCGRRTLVMGVLNVTPDSFSDGGQFDSVDSAVAHAEEMIAAGADIIDVGGESTRPGGDPMDSEEESRRVLPVIERLVKFASVPLSIDTTKAVVARAAIEAGAEIINDISGLRFDPDLADVAATTGAGLVLMHSRGEPQHLHGLEPVDNIMTEVQSSLRWSIGAAILAGVELDCITIDPGIGFGKSQDQNIELIAKLNALKHTYPRFPILIGPSRKSFIGRLLAGASVDKRLFGTMASITAAVLNGANIVRVHDVAAAVETVKVADAIRLAGRSGSALPT